MPDSIEISRYADELLDTSNTPDYPNAINGLQLESRGDIRGLAAAVDFSTRAIEGAIANEANLLLVHHGMFWGGLEPLVGPTYARLDRLVSNGVGVYSSHLPLDRHSVFGNNVLLARELGLDPTEPFASHDGVSIGFAGISDVQTGTLFGLASDFARREGGIARASRMSPDRRTKSWAVCTGAGASAETLSEARKRDIDTLIVGEGAHWTAVAAEEYDIALIYAGHYATETLGVRALAKHLGETFSLPWTFVSAPTGL